MSLYGGGTRASLSDRRAFRLGRAPPPGVRGGERTSPPARGTPRATSTSALRALPARVLTVVWLLVHRAVVRHVADAVVHELREFGHLPAVHEVRVHRPEAGAHAGSVASHRDVAHAPRRQHEVHAHRYLRERLPTLLAPAVHGVH